MTLLLVNPEIPTCADCQRWVYDDRWRPAKQRGTNEPMPRPAGSPTPCYKCPKSVDGKPHPERDLAGRVLQAFHYYLRCRVDTTGILPRDALTIRNNSIIDWLRHQAEQTRSNIAPIINSLLGAIRHG